MIKVLLSVFFVVLASFKTMGQSGDCITIDSSQKILYLNGDNFTLIDNALRCFKLNSVAEQRDTLVRVWILDSNFPDSPTIWRVKMFEFGKRNSKTSFATSYLLEWGFEGSDSSLPVKCIKQKKMVPNEGWQLFEKDIQRLNLPVLYKKPLINDGFVTVDFGMLIIQFQYGHSTHTVDFTGLVNVSQPANTLQLDYSKRILYLLWYIEKHFSLNLSAGSKDTEFLEEAKKRLNLLK